MELYAIQNTKLRSDPKDLACDFGAYLLDALTYWSSQGIGMGLNQCGGVPQVYHARHMSHDVVMLLLQSRTKTRYGVASESV